MPAFEEEEPRNDRRDNRRRNDNRRDNNRRDNREVKGGNDHVDAKES